MNTAPGFKGNVNLFLLTQRVRRHILYDLTWLQSVEEYIGLHFVIDLYVFCLFLINFICVGARSCLNCSPFKIYSGNYNIIPFKEKCTLQILCKHTYC